MQEEVSRPVSFLPLQRLLSKRQKSKSAQNSGGSNMRWTPFPTFEAKIVGIEEDEVVKEELYNKVEYRWLECPVLGGNQQNSDEGSQQDRTESSGLCKCSSKTIATLLERREACGPSVREILTAENEKIDNTGTFHWPTEDLLTSNIMRRWFTHQSGAAESLRALNPLSMLEIGAGCGLAAFAITNSDPSGAVRVVATDGNSRVVEALKRNVDRSSGEDDRNKRVVPMRLQWQSLDERAAAFDALRSFEGSSAASDPPTSCPIGKLPPNRRKVLFGADCLFFEDYHTALADLVIAFHKEFQVKNVNDVALPITLLMAPSRGESFERFEALIQRKIEQSGLGIRCRREEALSEAQQALHQRLSGPQPSEPSSSDNQTQELGGTYLPARHYPLMLVVD